MLFFEELGTINYKKLISKILTDVERPEEIFSLVEEVIYRKCDWSDYGIILSQTEFQVKNIKVQEVGTVFNNVQKLALDVLYSDVINEYRKRRLFLFKKGEE